MENMIENIDWFVLAHGVPNQPVILNDIDAEFEVIRGAGVDPETFEKIVADEYMNLRIKMWCEYAKCNQVVVSRDGYPEGFYQQ